MIIFFLPSIEWFFRRKCRFRAGPPLFTWDHSFLFRVEFQRTWRVNAGVIPGFPVPARWLRITERTDIWSGLRSVAPVTTTKTSKLARRRLHTRRQWWNSLMHQRDIRICRNSYRLMVPTRTRTGYFRTNTSDESMPLDIVPGSSDRLKGEKKKKKETGGSRLWSILFDLFRSY